MSLLIVDLGSKVTGQVTDRVFSGKDNTVGHLCPFVSTLFLNELTFDLDLLHVYGS